MNLNIGINKVFKDGYSKEFQTKEGNKYEIAVKDSELYLNGIDKFEDIFGFHSDVLKENDFMDIMNPIDFKEHKSIIENMLEVYCEFGEKYLEQEYQPDLYIKKLALQKLGKTYDIDESLFDRDDSLLTKKEKQEKELLMKAFAEAQEEQKQNKQEQERKKQKTLFY